MVGIQERQQQAGSGGGEGLLLRTLGGSFQSGLHMRRLVRCAVWLSRAAAEQGARLRQTVSLLQRRLVIGTLKQFSVVFVNKVSLFPTTGMKMRF